MENTIQNQKSNQKFLEVRIPIETQEKKQDVQPSCSDSPRRVKYSSLSVNANTITNLTELDDESELKIKELVEKTTNMSKQCEMRENDMSEAFKTLKEKLELNDQFLKSKKEQLQKMISKFQRDRVRLSHADHIGDCFENSNKTTQELESEMDKITQRIDKLKIKVQRIKEEQPEKDDNTDYKVALEKGIQELEKVNIFVDDDL